MIGDALPIPARSSRRRPSHTGACFLLLLGALLALGACTREEHEPEPAVTQSDRGGPLVLTRTLSATELDAVSTLRVRTTIEFVSGQAAPEITGFGYEDAGWTVRDTQSQLGPGDSPGTVRIERVRILEPFLDGDYSAPGGRFSLRTADGVHEAALDPIPVKVVAPPPLPPGSETADPLRPGPILIPTLNEPVPGWWAPAMIASAGLAVLMALVVCAIILRAITRRAAAGPDALRSLRSMLSSPDPDPDRLCDAASRALTQAPELGSHETEAALERLRFSGVTPPRARAVELARAILERANRAPGGAR